VFSDPSRIVQYADGNVFRVVTVAFTVEVEDFGRLRSSAESERLAFVARDELGAVDLVATHRPIVDRYPSGAQIRVRLIELCGGEYVGLSLLVDQLPDEVRRELEPVAAIALAEEVREAEL
jgi:hypothetical protein